MKKYYNKIIGILKVISIVNIVVSLISYILAARGEHSFNITLSPDPKNLGICNLVVLFLQIINIVFLQIQDKKEYNNRIKTTIIIAIILIIITIFIPVKRQSSVTYIQPDRDKTISIGRTIYKYKYKNIYSITLKTEEKTKGGIDIY